MSAEGTPQDNQFLLAALLSWLTRRVMRSPTVVVLAGLALAAAALLITIDRLGFRTSRLDLLNPDSGYNKLWIQYIDEFGDKDDTVVVVEGTNQSHVIPVLEELAHVLSYEDQLFHAVLHEVDLSKIRSKGLHYMSLDNLHQLEHFQQTVSPVLRGNWAQLSLRPLLSNLSQQLEPSATQAVPSHQADTVQLLDLLIHSLLDSITQNGPYHSPWQGMHDSMVTLSQIESEYLLTKQGQLGFVLLRLSDSNDRFAQGTQAIKELRRLIAQVQANHPHVKIGLTGLPVMENDEMQASQQDSLRAGIISLVGVACLFVAGFGGIRHPILTVGALLIAIAWSLGYLTLAIGHLNILSMSFGVILIGLGIDFGIHYVARYIQLRQSGTSSESSLLKTARSVGPGIITGGMTTALAFFTAGLTEFTGIAELGLIAGGGVLLCVLATLLVLPALIILTDRQVQHSPDIGVLHVDRLIQPLLNFPRIVLLVSVTACVLIGSGIWKVRYDHNLLNLQPVGLESVQLERKLLTETNQSVWFALSIAETREELLALKDRFLKLSSVDRTEEIVSLLPTDPTRKREIIERIGSRLRSLDERPPLIPATSPEHLGRLLAITANRIPPDNPRSRAIRRCTSAIRDRLRQMSPAECYEQIADFQQRMAGDLLTRLHLLRSMANPEPPTLGDLPASLVTRFVGKSNHHLLKIYGRGDIWDMTSLEKFVNDVKTVDPDATGKPLQTYYASRQMQFSYIQAAGFSFVAVVIVLLLDFCQARVALTILAVGLTAIVFLRLPLLEPNTSLLWLLATCLALFVLFERRGVTMVAMALLPLAAGMLMLFGTLGYLNIPLNPANMIVLPLILGIGIDDGVHVVHDFRRQRPGQYQLSRSTAAAVLLTSLTTMVGFGSMMLAGHQGLQSLGRVLTIGVFFCMFSSLILLPAILSWKTGGKAENDDDVKYTDDSDNASVQPTQLTVFPPSRDPGSTQQSTAVHDKYSPVFNPLAHKTDIAEPAS